MILKQTQGWAACWSRNSEHMTQCSRLLAPFCAHPLHLHSQWSTFFFQGQGQVLSCSYTSDFPGPIPHAWLPPQLDVSEHSLRVGRDKSRSLGWKPKFLSMFVMWSHCSLNEGILYINSFNFPQPVYSYTAPNYRGGHQEKGKKFLHKHTFKGFIALFFIMSFREANCTSSSHRFFWCLLSTLFQSDTPEKFLSVEETCFDLSTMLYMAYIVRYAFRGI